jgi:hypothetical protein
VPEHFSWIDHALVQRHLIDRCDARDAALYLFLVTVADAQGLSYYGDTTLMQRLHLSPEELGAALAIAGTTAAPRTASTSPASSSPPGARDAAAPVSLALLLGRLEHRRGRL